MSRPGRLLRVGFTLASLFLGVHLLLPLAGGLEATAEALAFCRAFSHNV